MIEITHSHTMVKAEEVVPDMDATVTKKITDMCQEKTVTFRGVRSAQYVLLLLL